MAVELTANAAQTVAAGANVLFTDTPVSCNRGYVVHREGAGITALRGICTGCSRFARYRVAYYGNISIPAEGTVEAISIALSLGGEALPSTIATVTPVAVGNEFNVATAAFVDVPAGCCNSLAVKNISTQAITATNSNLIIERVA